MKPMASQPSIEGTETIYDYPWTPQLVETLKKWYSEGIISPEVTLHAWGDIKYHVANWLDFISLPFEDLELLGKAGRRFDSIYTKGDAPSIETIRKIVKSELEKNIRL